MLHKQQSGKHHAIKITGNNHDQSQSPTSLRMTLCTLTPTDLCYHTSFLKKRLLELRISVTHLANIAME